MYWTSKKPSPRRFRPPRPLTQPVARCARVRSIDLLALRTRLRSSSRCRFRPPRSPTFGLCLAASPLGLRAGLRPTCVPCSTQEQIYGRSDRIASKTTHKTDALCTLFRGAHSHTLCITGGELCGEGGSGFVRRWAHDAKRREFGLVGDERVRDRLAGPTRLEAGTTARTERPALIVPNARCAPATGDGA